MKLFLLYFAPLDLVDFPCSFSRVSLIDTIVSSSYVKIKFIILKVSSIQQIQKEIIEEFSLFDDWTQRYEYMIDLGKTLPLIEAKYKNDNFIIKGCQSKVWVHA